MSDLPVSTCSTVVTTMLTETATGKRCADPGRAAPSSASRRCTKRRGEFGAWAGVGIAATLVAVMQRPANQVTAASSTSYCTQHNSQVRCC